MKFHDGKCTGTQACERTHGYKCRICGSWYKQNPQRNDRYVVVHAFYPYCSESCYDTAQGTDKGVPLFKGKIESILADKPDQRGLYPNPQVHRDFNTLISQTKEL